MMQQGISQKKTARLKGAQDFFLRNRVAFLDVSAPNLFLCEEKEEKIHRNPLQGNVTFPPPMGTPSGKGAQECSRRAAQHFPR